MENIVGQNVRRFRREQRYSQIALAKAAGVSPDTINSLERGRQQPRNATLRSIADVLGLEVVDFYRPPDAWIEHRMPAAELSDEDLEDIRRLLEGGSPVARFLEDDPIWLRNVSWRLLEETRRLRRERREAAEK